MYSNPAIWGTKAYEGMCDWTYQGITYHTYEEIKKLKCMYGVLVQTAGRRPDAIAVTDDAGQSYTFRELLEKTDAFAEYLYETQGIRKGRRIGMMLFNSIEFCVTFFALSKLGAVCVSLPTKFKREEVNSLADKAEVSGIVCSAEYAEWFDAQKARGCLILPVENTPGVYGLAPYSLRKEQYTACEAGLEDVAIIMFTSGTTSQSKGAVLRNFNILHAIIAYERILNITMEDRTVTPTPMYHITGMVAILSLFVYVGARLYLLQRFDAARIMRMVKAEQLTFIHSTPTVFIMLLEQRVPGETIESVRALACGSSTMPVRKIQELHEWMPNMQFRTCYGLTETTSVGSTFPGDAAVSPHCGSSGQPAPGMDFAVWDDEGHEVPAGSCGEIMVRGGGVLCEYLGMDSELIENGWLHTGDIGYFDSEGYIYIVDRKKDMINYGGEKVPSSDIENAIYHIPGVKEAAVIGVKDERYGEIVGAAISMRSGASLTLEQLQEELRPRMAKFKIPKVVEFMDEIPKTENNKIDKKRLRAMFNAIYHKTDSAG